METLTKHLKNLNTSKSMGPDGCHPRVLIETYDIINKPMQNIFDKTFKEGKVPDIWKEANITALYKNKGDKSDTTNYRPVSLTCLPSRLCEKTVRESIMNHMTLRLSIIYLLIASLVLDIKEAVFFSCWTY